MEELDKHDCLYHEKTNCGMNTNCGMKTDQHIGYFNKNGNGNKEDESSILKVQDEIKLRKRSSKAVCSSFCLNSWAKQCPIVIIKRLTKIGRCAPKFQTVDKNIVHCKRLIASVFSLRCLL